MIHISRGVRIRLPFSTLIIATTMAAFRRLASIVNRLNVWSAPRNELLGAQTTTGGRTQRCLAVGVCLATGGAVAFYFYNDTYSQRCRKRMGYNFSGRDLLPVLSAVEAQQKVQDSILHYVLWQDSLWKNATQRVLLSPKSIRVLTEYKLAVEGILSWMCYSLSGWAWSENSWSAAPISMCFSNMFFFWNVVWKPQTHD